MQKLRKKEEEISSEAQSHKQNTVSSSKSQIPKGDEDNKTWSVEGESGSADHSSTGMPRGKYRQYEDNQIVIEKIRYYRTRRYPDCE